MSWYFPKRRFFFRIWKKISFHKNTIDLRFKNLVWRAFFKNLRICGWKWCLRVDRRCNLCFWKYLDTCGRGLRCETASGIVQCYSHQACCLLCCLFHINNGSQTYQFTFELLLLGSRMWLWFQIWTKKYLRIDGFGQKKGTDLHTPIHSPLHWIKFI